VNAEKSSFPNATGSGFVEDAKSGMRLLRIVSGRFDFRKNGKSVAD
jgi:hypothetical protein